MSASFWQSIANCASVATRQYTATLYGFSIFSPGLSCDVLNSYALSCVYHHALGQTGNFRRVKDANEIVVDFKALRPAFARSLGLIDNDFFYQLIEDRRGQLLNIGVLFHRLEETGGAVLALFFRVYLRLQGGDFLFQSNLFIVIPLGNHHKPLVRKFAVGVVLVGFSEKAIQLGTSGQHGAVDKVPDHKRRACRLSQPPAWAVRPAPGAAVPAPTLIFPVPAPCRK